MAESETFFTLAEVAVALAASTGIILALAREPERWSGFDAVRVFLLLASSLGATVLSLLPAALAITGVSGGALWRTCSAVLAVYVATFLAVAFRRVVSLPAGERRDFRPSLAVSFNAVNVAVVVAQVLNAGGLFGGGSPSPFLLGLLWLVTWSATLFALLILLRPSSRPSSRSSSR